MKKPTVIKDFPGQAVEKHRLTHGGKLPIESLQKPSDASIALIIEEVFEYRYIKYPCFVDLKLFWDAISDIEMPDGAIEALDTMVCLYLDKYQKRNP